MKMNKKTLSKFTRDSFLDIAGVYNAAKEGNLLHGRWAGKQGAERLGSDLMSIGAVAAAGIVGFKAISGISSAGDGAIDSAASAAGNLLGYRLTYGALSMVPGLR